MSHRRRWFAPSLTATALLALGACGGPDVSSSVGKPSSDNTAELDASKDKVSISGTVSVGGKTMTGGDLNIDARTSSRSEIPVVKASIDSSGKYTAKTNVGTNHFSVSAPGLSDKQKSETFTKIVQPSDTSVDVTIP